MAPPTTVILPTVRHTDVVDQLASQLGPDDELLVVCDTDSDPIAGVADSFPKGVRLVIAGEPEGCSGKANASWPASWALTTSCSLSVIPTPIPSPG